MRAKSKKVATSNQKSVASAGPPRSLKVAQEGIRTGGQFAQMMSCLMSDVIEGAITPQVANATVNAGGKLLKVVELQLKYGKPNPDGSNRRMDLIEIGEGEQISEH